jgi:hypothetical protein
MVDTREPNVYAAPSPIPPTEAELAAWQALSRDEQLARYREALHHPDCDRISEATMADVLIMARKRVAARWLNFGFRHPPRRTLLDFTILQQ